MAPHTIVHFINDHYTSCLRETCDIKYHILYIEYILIEY